MTNTPADQSLIDIIASGDTMFIWDLSTLTLKAYNPGQMQDYVAAFADKEVSRPELKDYAETKTAPSSSSGTLTLDLENGNVFEVTLTENVTTTTFNNPSATGRGCSFTLILKQNGTGGYTFAWPSAVDWAGGLAPTLTTTASAVDILTFVTTDAGTRWYGFFAGGDMK